MTKASHAKRRKTCSRNCSKIHKSQMYSGDGNPRYGIYGQDHHKTIKNNIGDTKINSHGYIMEFVSSRRWYRQHRLLAEKYLVTDDSMLDSKGRLKTKYSVHHIDGNKQNNNIDNLEIMLKGEHSRYHNLKNPIPHSKYNGRFISVVQKSRELLENPEEDNQQPS